MKCPRCGVENGSRTICNECGYFMYRAVDQNRKQMTKSERAREDAKIIWKNVSRVLRVAWMVLVIIVMSFLMIAVLTYFFNGV